MNCEKWIDYSDLFENESLISGFTKSNFPYLAPTDRLEFASILGINSEQIVKPKQVHSNEVYIINEPGEFLNIDGIITNKLDLVLSIQVADCIPIFVYDNQYGIIGLVHAGWRGIAKGIVENTISQLKLLNSNLKDVKVLLGPSIRQCCFEIGPEVAEKFNKKYLKIGIGDRSYLDLQSVVISKFLDNGLFSSKIIDIEKCTCCSDNYHSYRRNGEKAGRMIAMMGWKK